MPRSSGAGRGKLWVSSVFIDCVESDELIGDARCSGHVGFFDGQVVDSF